MPSGKMVYTFPEVVPAEVCETLIGRLHGGRQQQYIYNNAALAAELYGMISPYVESPIQFTGLGPHITMSNSTRPVTLHTDTDKGGNHWKMFVYLNEVPNGGTVFVDCKKEYLVENRRGSVVLFDIRLQHKGQPTQAPVPKYVLGFRPLTEQL